MVPILGAGHHSDLTPRLKTLTPKQMLQRLLIALAQGKTCNASGKLLNEIRRMIYALYQAKEITKNIYKNIMNSGQI